MEWTQGLHLKDWTQWKVEWHGGQGVAGRAESWAECRQLLGWELSPPLPSGLAFIPGSLFLLSVF